MSKRITRRQMLYVLGAGTAATAPSGCRQPLGRS